jgi:general secretion pathway protein I
MKQRSGIGSRVSEARGRKTDPRRFVDSAHSLTPKTPGPRPLAPGSRFQTGYTLIEVIVAFAVLALALTLLLGTLSGASKQVRWADDAGRASLHAQSLIDQLGVGEALAPGQRQGDFENGRYHWQHDIAPWRDPAQPPANDQPQDFSAPSLLAVSLRVAWGDAANQQLQVSTLRLVQPEPAGVEP